LSAAAKTKAEAQRKRKYRAQAKAAAKQPTITQERYQHNQIGYRAFSPQPGDIALKVLDQRWIDAYNLRGQLTDREWRAANYLYHRWYQAKVQRALTGGYDGGSSGAKGRKGGKRPTEVEPHSEPLADVWAALRALPADWKELMQAVAIHDQPATSVRGVVNMHPIMALKAACRAVADHFHNSGVSGFERDEI
jgi:hypothetical protein